MKKYRIKIILDMMLNIVATAVPLVMLQILILPFLAKQISADEYGYLMAVVSLVTIISNTLGNSLNNVRLLNQEKCKRLGLLGDFNRILLYEVIICIIAILVGLVYLKTSVSLSNIIGILLYAIITLVREYYIVSFRIELDYVAVVWNNLALSVGYVLGFILFGNLNILVLPYLLGELFACGHALYRNSLLKEGIKRTELFKENVQKTCALGAAGVLSNALGYSDRLIIYPMLGGTAVSVYYAASFLGKIVSSGMSPVAAVVLSYLSKKEQFSVKRFGMILCGVTGIGVLGYVFGICVSEPVLSVLYPVWMNDAMKLIKVTTATTMIAMITSVVKPFALKYCNINWQIILNFISFVIYFLFAISLFNIYGLIGFCYGVFISNVVKCIAFCVIVWRKMDRTIS